MRDDERRRELFKGAGLHDAVYVSHDAQFGSEHSITLDGFKIGGLKAVEVTDAIDHPIQLVITLDVASLNREEPDGPSG